MLGAAKSRLRRRRPTRTIRDDRKPLYGNDLWLVPTVPVSLRICKNEPDFVGSNGMATDEVGGEDGSEAKSLPGDPTPLRSGFFTRPRPPRQQRLRGEASSQSRRPTRGRLPRPPRPCSGCRSAQDSCPQSSPNLLSGTPRSVPESVRAAIVHTRQRLDELREAARGAEADLRWLEGDGRG